MTLPSCLNLACGATFVDAPHWLNLDYTPLGAAVRQADLLGRLPVADASLQLVYSSHFLEHVPRTHVAGLLKECHRVLRPGGLLRLVVPDLQEMCSCYLQARHAGEHEKADAVVLEIVDQCVRKRPGGELAALYDRVRTGPADPALRRFIFERSGETLADPGVETRRPFMARLQGAIERRYIRALVRLLPRAFRQQNVSLAEVGELHAWLYDAHTLGALLLQAGFGQLQRMAFNQSAEPTFPLVPLDATPAGEPRKGLQSLYLEARA